MRKLESKVRGAGREERASQHEDGDVEPAQAGAAEEQNERRGVENEIDTCRVRVRGER